MATKLDQIKNSLGGKMSESMGVGRTPVRLHAPGATAAADSTDERLRGIVRNKSAVEIPLDRIIRDDNQPREEFDQDALARLADSLRTRGQLQPIRVRWDEGRGVYVIICGERRWRAAAMAGMSRIACMIHEGPIDVLMVQLIENALREDLKPVEQAKAYQALIDRNGWEHQRLAAELSITGPTISRCLALLSLPPEVQVQVDQGKLSPSAAYEVAKLDDPVEQVAFAQTVIDGKLTKNQVIDAVKTKRSKVSRNPQPVAVDFGDCTVTVRWKRPSSMTALEALAGVVEHLKARTAS